MTSRAPGLTRAGWVVGTMVATFACGGTEPGGTLTISLDSYAKVTSANNITLTGTVTRTPANKLPLVVRATGGVGTPFDTADAGRFTLPITLNPNATNQLKVSASDASRSTSDSVSVSIQQDNQAPTIAQATPADATDNVALSTTILVRLSEAALVSAGGGVRLTRQGATIPGSSSISADSLTLTFVPSGSLSPNAIYRVGFTGVTDVVGNAPTTTACFLTTRTGATRSDTLADPDPGMYQTNPPPTGLSVPDILSARFAREGTLFSGIVRFAGPRVFSSTASNRVSVIMDFDLDQDSTTGFETFKDTLFGRAPNTELGTSSSGMGAEFTIGLEPHPGLGDSAYVGSYTAPGQFTPVRRFIPDACGAFMGFVVPWTDLANDDGNLNIVLVGLAELITQTSFLAFADPVPAQGNLQLTLSATGPARHAGAPPTAQAGGPIVRHRIPRSPLH